MFEKYYTKHFHLLVITLFMIIWLKYNCYNNFIWWLESIPVLIALPILSYKKFNFTNFSYYLILIHFIILLIGSHYTYKKMPLFDYLKAIFNLSFNHYDRFGHFAQGFIPSIITRELLIRTSSLKPGKWLVALTIMSILGISSLYEILEWLVAINNGESASGFLAIQGDIWDTQKDMALAGIGSMIAMYFLVKSMNSLQN